MSSTPTAARRVLTLGALVAAGEAIFLLPFVLPRVFRSTVLDVLNIDNTQLGAAFSTYGIVAMVSYLLGGPLADRFSTRRMMTAALLATAVGGLYYATLPSYRGLVVLYGYWGMTTILLFWAGLLRATREWGGERSQGTAYGLLDGGRGLFAAVLSTLALSLFALWMIDGSPRAALQAVVLCCSGMVALAGVAIWWLIPEGRLEGSTPWRLADLTTLAARPTTWFQGAIVVCAYVGYKGTDDLALLTSDVFGYSDVAAASVGTLAFWIRPVAAVTAGLLADRIGGWRTVGIGFGLLVVSDLAVAFGVAGPSLPIVLGAIVSTCIAVYALRGVYFALFEEAAVPVTSTGTAVGLVSVLGYTPDIFFGPLMGWVLDRSPGATGHRDLFLLLALFASMGLLATVGFALTRPRTGP